MSQQSGKSAASASHLQGLIACVTASRNIGNEASGLRVERDSPSRTQKLQALQQRVAANDTAALQHMANMRNDHAIVGLAGYSDDTPKNLISWLHLMHQRIDAGSPASYTIDWCIAVSDRARVCRMIDL